MSDLGTLLLYLPALLLAVVAYRAADRFFDAYRVKHGDAALSSVYPRRYDDWFARYAHRPWAWLRDTPMLARNQQKLTLQADDDPLVESLRREAMRWGVASLVAMVIAMIANIVLVSAR